MRLSKEDVRICDAYRAKDALGFVHCKECPMVMSRRDVMCKANCTDEEWEEFKEPVTFKLAIESLKSKYEEAKGLGYVVNPIGWALYQVWKEVENL